MLLPVQDVDAPPMAISSPKMKDVMNKTESRVVVGGRWESPECTLGALTHGICVLPPRAARLLSMKHSTAVPPVPLQSWPLCWLQLALTLGCQETGLQFRATARDGAHTPEVSGKAARQYRREA